MAGVPREGGAPLAEFTLSVRHGIDLLAFVTDHGYVAESLAHFALRLLAREPSDDQLLDSSLDVKAQLPLDLAAQPVAGGGKTKELWPAIPTRVAHGVACVITRFTASV